MCASDVSGCQGTETPASCTCETRCTEEAPNGACPVCQADPARCKGDALTEPSAEDQAAAKAVSDRIAALTGESTEEDVQAARAAYDALTGAQKALVTHLDTLTALEQRFAAAAAVAAVEELLAALPGADAVTLDDRPAIQAARAAYSVMTAEQQSQVSEALLEKLADAERVLNALLAVRGAYTITADMGQAEIDAAVAQAEGVITVQPGNYGVENTYKSIRLTRDAAISLSGVYEHFHLIIDNGADVTVQSDGAVLQGQVLDGIGSENGFYYGDYYTGILIKHGSLNVNTSLTLSDYNMAIKLGIGGSSNPAELNVGGGALLTIRNCHQTDHPSSGSADYWGGGMEEGDGVTGGQGHGATGSGIFVAGTGEAAVNVSGGAVLGSTGNWGALYATTGYLTLHVDAAAAHFDESTGWDGIYSCDNTSVSRLRIELTHGAALSCNGNRRNGITGQGDMSRWRIDASGNSTFTCDGNRAIGINNMGLVLSASGGSVSGNGSHGATNVALDAENAQLTCSGNRYLGLNITNVGAAQTNITQNSAVAVNGNGGAGIRFQVTSGTQIHDSTIEATGSGVGTSLYGYAVKPGDSGYWADVAAKATVNVTGSIVTVGTWSLYNSSGSKLPSVWNLAAGANIVRVSSNPAFETGRDIFDDPADTVAGRTIVTSGSLNGSRRNMSGTYEFATLNPQENLDDTLLKPATAVYAAPVNDYGTALTLFKVTNPYQSINVYDPNGKAAYDYTTAYDDGSDFVWAAVVVVHYDATEGTIQANGTAQSGAPEQFQNMDDGTQIGCAATDAAAGYEVSDYTINGADLHTTGRTLPTAARSGYMFGGWYYVTEENVQAAEAAAAAGAWETLYKLFAGKFSGNSAVAEEDSQITVYAKWNEPAPTPSGDPWEPTPTPRPTPAATPTPAPSAAPSPAPSVPPTPAPETEIPDDPAPLEPAPDAPADIPEAPVPQGDLPQTGSVRQSDARGLGAVALSMSAALFAGGILLRRKEKNGG